MAKVYITEYARQALDNHGQPIAAGEEPPITTQTVAIGGASAQSAVFNAKTRFIRVHTDAICSVLVGANPTADANSPRMAANQTEFFGLLAPTNPADGSGLRMAVITNT